MRVIMQDIERKDAELAMQRYQKKESEGSYPADRKTDRVDHGMLASTRVREPSPPQIYIQDTCISHHPKIDNLQ